MNKLFIMILLIMSVGCTGMGEKQTTSQAEVEDHTLATGGSKNGDSADSQVTTGTYQEGEAVSQGKLSDAEKYSTQALNNPNSVLSIRTIYFNYDSSAINAESQEILQEHARFLSFNPSIQVVLEGHTDERGTRNYNLALGERRAKAVHEYLVAHGVNSLQLEPISYGEESPVALESDESSWQLNRRVELTYPVQP